MPIPKIEKVDITTKDTEYSFVIPNKVSKLAIGKRLPAGNLKVAWKTGDIASGNYKTVFGERFYDAMNLYNREIFFTSTEDSDTAEIELFI